MPSSDNFTHDFIVLSIDPCGLPDEGLRFAWQDTYKMHKGELEQARANDSIRLRSIPGQWGMVAERHLDDAEIHQLAFRMAEHDMNRMINMRAEHNR